MIPLFLDFLVYFNSHYQWPLNMQLISGSKYRSKWPRRYNWLPGDTQLIVIDLVLKDQSSSLRCYLLLILSIDVGFNLFQDEFDLILVYHSMKSVGSCRLHVGNRPTNLYIEASVKLSWSRKADEICRPTANVWEDQRNLLSIISTTEYFSLILAW